MEIEVKITICQRSIWQGNIIDLLVGTYPRKTSARRQSDEGLATSLRIKRAPYVQMRSVGYHITSEMKRTKERKRIRYPTEEGLLLIEPWPVVNKRFTLVLWCHQLLSGILAKGHLPQMLRQSRLSANDKGDNEVKPEPVHWSPSICITAEKPPGKSQLGNHLMIAVWLVIASKWGR